jgi:DNA repair exonuclease SbcCD ATPase subunit
VTSSIKLVLDEQQTLLNMQGDGERRYEHAAQTGASRLASINPIPDGDGDASTCPVCSSRLPEDDPTVGQMRRSLDQLRDQLTSVETARPRRAAALAELDQRATVLRQELRAVEAALAGIRAADAQAEADQRRAQAQAFIQGRIDLYLTRLHHAG